jgi:hypothetical protein
VQKLQKNVSFERCVFFEQVTFLDLGVPDSVFRLKVSYLGIFRLKFDTSRSTGSQVAVCIAITRLAFGMSGA